MTRGAAAACPGLAGHRPASGPDGHPKRPALTLPSSTNGTMPPGNRQIKSPEVYLADAANPPHVQWLLLLQPITEHVDIHFAATPTDQTVITRGCASITRRISKCSSEAASRPR